MEKAIGKGYGKLILFGEHFVVYGLPGIASGIDKQFGIEMQKIEEDDIIVEDNIYYNETVKLSENPEHIKFTALKPVIDSLNLNKVKLTFSGDLARKGMGLSAAYAVATIRAANNLFSLNLDDKKINALAYECEKVSHGTPSGIDNTCATYGTPLWFEKNLEEGQNKIELFNIAKPLYLVIGDTGKTASTKEIVFGVKERREAEPEEYDEIFEQYISLVNEARIALQKGDIRMIGELMNNNQTLLREIGVSCDELEELIETSLEAGALGAKLSGAGKGGIMFALAENKESQEKIARAIENKGFKAIKTVIE
jgi:mevalonate kinase